MYITIFKFLLRLLYKATKYLQLEQNISSYQGLVPLDFFVSLFKTRLRSGWPYDKLLPTTSSHGFSLYFSVPKIREGTCPVVTEGIFYPIFPCYDQCSLDIHCPDVRMKCCYSSCGKQCTLPIELQQEPTATSVETNNSTSTSGIPFIHSSSPNGNGKCL